MSRSIPHRSFGVLIVATTLSAAACDGDPTGADDPLPEGCTDELTLPALSVGEGVRVSGGSAVLLCPSAAGEEGEYVLIAHNAAGDAADSTTLQVRPREILAPGSEPAPPGAVAAREGLPSASAPGGAMPNARQHAELRRLEREELAHRVSAVQAPAPGGPGGPARVTPEVGSLLDSLNAQSQSACDDPILRTGEVMAVSDRAIVVADTLNPSGGFSQSEYARFAATFDTLVAPLAEEAFGAPSEFSGDDRTILFYTQEVNRLTERGANTLVLGFFFARDLFPKDSCASSNEAEMLYLLVPDPEGEINDNEWEPDFVEARTLATLIHEYQHLINAGRRLHVLGASSFLEEVWLNEGLSHLAEELLFYRAAGLGPGMNLGIDELRDGGQRVIDAINAHQLTNVFRLRRYLEAPSTNSPYDPEALLPTRGASWHFLRYAVDRRGGGEHDLTRTLVDGPATGIDNLAGALGGEETLHEWLADWSVSLYADSRVPGVPARYRDRSWSHPSIFRALGEDEDPPQLDYPLRIVTLTPTGSEEQVLMGGGSAYFRFGLPASGVASLELTVDGRRPPAALRTTLVRVR